MALQNIHIKKIRIENYKSLKDSEIELKEGLNIIIGKNGAGKSNMLEFINRYATNFPKRIMKAVNTNFSISYEYTDQKAKHFLSYKIERKRVVANKNIQYTYELTLDEFDGRVEGDKKKGVLLHGTQVDDLIFFADDKFLSSKFPFSRKINHSYIPFVIPQNILQLSTTGKLVINELDDMPISLDEFTKYSDFSFIEKLQIEIEIKILNGYFEYKNENTDLIKEKLISISEYFIDQTSINAVLSNYTIIKEIRINPNINIYHKEENLIVENLLIDFLVDNDWVPWSYLSDGTKRMFYLISEALSFEQGIFLIEEPELGIHPHQLYKIMDFLKEQSRHKQIIISTHSPLVLDVLEEKELDRIIIAKYDNGTKFSHLTEEEISKAKRYMNEVGELSYYWLHSDLEK